VITQHLILIDPPEGTTGLHFTDTKIWACAGCKATIGEGNVIEHHDYCPGMPLGREREHVDRLKVNVRSMQESLERKNRQLDALHMVWCDGGCSSGVHRWSDALVTRELVETAERNTKRLRRWYRTVEFRMKLPGADAWQQERWQRTAAKTDLPDGSQ
jgi:hypothetical protein